MNYNFYEFEEKANKYGKKYNLQTNPVYPGWNDEIDAFRHVFMVTVYSLDKGETLAKWITDAYENIVGLIQGQSSNEKNMDLWNNYQGRRIADEIRKEYGKKFDELSESIQDDIIAKKVIQKMRKGELITNPSDKRKYTGFAAE